MNNVLAAGKLLVASILLAPIAFLSSGCSSSTDATYVSANISTDAENFKVLRKIVAINGITDTYLFDVEGYCSIEKDVPQEQLEITCLQGPNKYFKHFVGISDNVTYTVQQLDAIESDPYHFKWVIKPQSIVPFQNVEIR